MTDINQQNTLPYPPTPLPPYKDFWLLLVLFLSFRLLALLLFRPGGFIRDWSDFDTFLGIAALSDYGLYPFLDFWLEWPPLVPWLMVGAYKLSLLLPAWEDQRLWFILILGTVFVLFEAANFSLIYHLARRTLPGAEAVRRALWFYAGLFPPVYAMLGFFDGAALFFILLSLLWLLDHRLRPAGIAIGIGFMTKVTPLLMLPVALKVAWARRGSFWEALVKDWLWIFVCCLGVILLLAAPFLILAPEWLPAFGRALLGRSSWETVWAVLEGYYGFGRVAGDRLNPAETNFAIHPAALPWNAITLAFLALYAVIFFVKVDVSQPRRILAYAGLILTIFLIYSKGYSPQFLVYVLPFIILLMPNLTGLGYALALTLLNVLEQPIYFVFFPPDQFPSETWLLTFIVTARMVLWLALAVEFWVAVSGQQSAVSGQPTALRWMRWVLGGMLVLGLVVALPRMLQTYERVQLARSSQQTVIGFLRSQAGDPPSTLLLTEQALYRQLYPHLRGDYRLKLAGGDLDFPAAASTAQLVAGERQVWLLASGERGEAVAQEMESLAQPLASYTFDQPGRLTYFDLTGNDTPPPPIAQAENGLQLLGYQIEVGPDAIDLTLYWQTTQPLSADYTVFTHLLDSGGQRVAGHDSLPASGSQPTSTWPTTHLIADEHSIVLPNDLAAGEYQLVAGMYDRAGERLEVVSWEGKALTNSTVPLTYIELK